MRDDLSAGPVPAIDRSPIRRPIRRPFRLKAPRHRPGLAAVMLGLTVVACAPAGVTQSPASTTLPPGVAATQAATVAPTVEPPAPTPLNPAPAEMIGTWTSEFAEGDVATLDITATAIRISRFATATVRLEVFGDELVLSRSQLCVGEGRYRWSIVGDELRFDSVSPDACPDRAKTFDGATYTREPD